MRFRGYSIEPSYFVGSTFRMLESGKCIPRKPRKKDVEYYEIYEQGVSHRVGVEYTIAECRETIKSWG